MPQPLYLLTYYRVLLCRCLATHARVLIFQYPGDFLCGEPRPRARGHYRRVWRYCLSEGRRSPDGDRSSRDGFRRKTQVWVSQVGLLCRRLAVLPLLLSDACLLALLLLTGLGVLLLRRGGGAHLCNLVHGLRGRSRSRDVLALLSERVRVGGTLAGTAGCENEKRNPCCEGNFAETIFHLWYLKLRSGIPASRSLRLIIVGRRPTSWTLRDR